MSREEARRLFPFAAEKADELRAVFGPGVKLMYAKENGREIGKRVQRRQAFTVRNDPQQLGMELRA